MQYPKQTYKKHSRKSTHDFSAKVKKTEYEDAKGICRICHSEPITQYHHINEKGMGGGKGLGIQINCLGVGNGCHNHDNTEFLRQADKVLVQRIKELFGEYQQYTLHSISEKLNMPFDEVEQEAYKWALKAQYDSIKCTKYAYVSDIKIWLGVSA